MSQVEWAQAAELINEPDAANTVAEAREIVGQLFASSYAEGSVRMLDYARNRQRAPVSALQVEQFTQELHDLLIYERARPVHP